MQVAGSAFLALMFSARAKSAPLRQYKPVSLPSVSESVLLAYGFAAKLTNPLDSNRLLDLNHLSRQVPLTELILAKLW